MSNEYSVGKTEFFAQVKRSKKRKPSKRRRGGADLKSELKSKLNEAGITSENYNDKKDEARAIVNAFAKKNRYSEIITGLLDYETGLDQDDNNMLCKDKMMELLQSGDASGKGKRSRKRKSQKRR